MLIGVVELSSWNTGLRFGQLSSQNTGILAGVVFLLLGASSYLVQRYNRRIIRRKFDDEEELELLEGGLSFGRVVGWPVTVAIAVTILSLPRRIETAVWSPDGFVSGLLWTLLSWFAVCIPAFAVDFLAYSGLHSGLRRHSPIDAQGLGSGWIARTKLLAKAIAGTFLLCVFGVVVLAVLRAIAHTSVYLQFGAIYVLAIAFWLLLDALSSVYYRFLHDCQPLSDGRRRELEAVLGRDAETFRELWLENSPEPRVVSTGLLSPFRHVFLTRGVFEKLTSEARSAAVRHSQLLSQSVYNFIRAIAVFSIVLASFATNYYLLETGRTGPALLSPVFFGLVAYGLASWYGKRWVFETDRKIAERTSPEAMIEMLQAQLDDSEKLMYFPGLVSFLYMRPTVEQRLDALSSRTKS